MNNARLVCEHHNVKGRATIRKTVIGVMGGSTNASEQTLQWAQHLGREIAQAGWVLLSGGRPNGVMDAVSVAAHDAGGLVIGVLPFNDPDDCSVGVDVAIVTGMGSARNNINVLSSDVVIACGPVAAGTMSEIALAVKSSRPVVLLNDDKQVCAVLERMGMGLVRPVSTPDEALEVTRELLQKPAVLKGVETRPGLRAQPGQQDSHTRQL